MIEVQFYSGGIEEPTQRVIRLQGQRLLDLPDDYDAAKALVTELKRGLDALLATYPQPVPEGAGGFVEADRG